MSNNSNFIEHESFYDVETENSLEYKNDYAIDPNILREHDNNQNNCNKTLICNRIIYFLLLLSISFIIYQNYKTIYLYFSELENS